jgi:tape measure domain-containing protein
MADGRVYEYAVVIRTSLDVRELERTAREAAAVFQRLATETVQTSNRAMTAMESASSRMQAESQRSGRTMSAQFQAMQRAQEQSDRGRLTSFSRTTQSQERTLKTFARAQEQAYRQGARDFERAEQEKTRAAEKSLGVLSGIANRVRNLNKALHGDMTLGQSGDGGFLPMLANISSVIRAIPTVGQLAHALTSPLTQAAEAGIAYNDQLERASIAFETLTGSADKAKSHIASLESFAARTPFQFPDLVASSQELQAFGYKAEEIIPLMTSIGDAISATGDITKEKLNRVTLAFGEMQSAGRLNARQMLQLTEAGIPSWNLLAKAIGKSVDETRKLSEQGRLSGPGSARAIAAMLELPADQGGRAGLMDRLTKTYTGMKSNLEDIQGRAEGMATKSLFEDLKGIMDAGLKREDLAGAMAGSINSALTPVSGLVRTAAVGLLGGNLTAGAVEGIAAGKDAVRAAVGDLVSDGMIGEAQRLMPDVKASGAQLGGAFKSGFDLKSLFPSASNPSLSTGHFARANQFLQTPSFQQGDDTRAELERIINDPRVKSFLAAIRNAEHPANMPEADKYRELFGGKMWDLSQGSPFGRFGGATYKGQPTHAVLGYQFEPATWRDNTKALGINPNQVDPHTQDIVAAYLLKKVGALDAIFQGEIDKAIQRSLGTWPSLPGGSQQTRSREQFMRAFGGGSADLQRQSPSMPSSDPDTQRRINDVWSELVKANTERQKIVDNYNNLITRVLKTQDETFTRIKELERSLMVGVDERIPENTTDLSDIQRHILEGQHKEDELLQALKLVKEEMPKARQVLGFTLPDWMTQEINKTFAPRLTNRMRYGTPEESAQAEREAETIAARKVAELRKERAEYFASTRGMDSAEYNRKRDVLSTLQDTQRLSKDDVYNIQALASKSLKTFDERIKSLTISLAQLQDQAARAPQMAVVEPPPKFTDFQYSDEMALRVVDKFKHANEKLDDVNVSMSALGQSVIPQALDGTNALGDAALLAAENLRRQTRGAGEWFDQVVTESEKSGKAAEKAAQTFAGIFGDTFAAAILKPREAFQTLRQEFTGWLAGMFRDLATSQLYKVLRGDDGKGGIFGAILGRIFGGSQKQGGAAQSAGSTAEDVARNFLPSAMPRVGGSFGFGLGPTALNGILNAAQGQGISIPTAQTGGITAATLANAGMNQASIFGTLSAGNSAAAAGKFSLSALGSSFAPLAPLLGLSLGSQLGGKGLGGILGGAGGLLLGGAGATALLGGSLGVSASIFGATGSASLAGLGGTVAGLLSNPFTIAAGAALLVGAMIYKKNKARQEAEKVRNQLSQDTLSAVYQILWDAQAGSLSVAQARARWNQIESDYMSKAHAIKDSKTRRNAELWFTRDVTPIWSKIEDAAKKGEKANAFKADFVPTFDSGGWVNTNNAARWIKVRPGERFMPPHEQERLIRNGGIIPGVDRGVDDTYMEAPVGSLVLNQKQQVQGLDGGGYVGGGVPATSSTPASGGQSKLAPIIIKQVHISINALTGLVQMAMQSEDGRDIIAHQVALHIDKEGTDGILGDIMNELAKRGIAR